MKRAMWIAAGMCAVISGAAAIGVDAPTAPPAGALSHAERAVALDTARRAQREAIETRYQADRAACEAFSGVRRDRCLIQSHARKGRAMLEAAAPYASRS